MQDVRRIQAGRDGANHLAQSSLRPRRLYAKFLARQLEGPNRPLNVPEREILVFLWSFGPLNLGRTELPEKPGALPHPKRNPRRQPTKAACRDVA